MAFPRAMSSSISCGSLPVFTAISLASRASLPSPRGLRGLPFSSLMYLSVILWNCRWGCWEVFLSVTAVQLVAESVLSGSQA